MTPKQKLVLDFIEKFSNENGYAPSQHEIAENFGFKSLGTVQNYLVRLERNGSLQRSWNAKRAIQVIDKTQTQPTHSQISFEGTVPIPLVGRVAAGYPIEAIETDETLDVPASMLKRGEHFVLRVQGDSMIEDGILDGDFVVIKKQPDARNGETVVALVGNEATIKRLQTRENVIELHPANPAYQPIVIESMVDNDIPKSKIMHYLLEGGMGRVRKGDEPPGSGTATDFKIEGVLVGLIRRLG